MSGRPAAACVTPCTPSATGSFYGRCLPTRCPPDAPLFEEWLAEQRSTYQALYQQGLFHLAERYRTEQRLPEARRSIETLLTLDPTNEAAHQMLMRIYVQLGNQAAALRQYENLRGLLVEELGINPDLTTQALHLELLQADTLPPRTRPQV